MAMAVAQVGDRVQVMYFPARRPNRHPDGKLLEFTVGSSEVIAGISRGVVGMAEGEQKHLILQPQDAYGVVRRQLIKELPRKKFARHLDLHPGKRLVTVDADGRRRRVTVVRIKRDSVIVDANHPLAGDVLEVDIRLITLQQSPANHEKPQFDVGGEG
jgi:FKBP-type peptidyl-prolyl cis-trans isomerase 2